MNDKEQHDRMKQDIKILSFLYKELSGLKNIMHIHIKTFME